MAQLFLRVTRMRDFKFKAIIRRWTKGRLHIDELLFYYLEDALNAIKEMEDFDSCQVENHHGHVVHEQKCHKKKHCEPDYW